MTEPNHFRVSKCSQCGSKKYVINGRWLRWIREHARPKMSLRRFASELGFSAAYVSDIERNNRGCSYEVQEAYEHLETDR